MTKKEAIKHLIQYVENDIIAGCFENDPEYKYLIDAINKLTQTRSKDHGF